MHPSRRYTCESETAQEAAPLEAPNAELSNPTGVATDAGAQAWIHV